MNTIRDCAGKLVHDVVRGSVVSAMWGSVGDAVGDSAVWGSVGSAVRESVVYTVRNSVWESARDSVKRFKVEE